MPLFGRTDRRAWDSVCDRNADLQFDGRAFYTIQRYLQYNTLVQNNLQHFDAWASTFGETITAVELTPEGTGYRAKTRFARFYNLPELMAMFKEIADIKTADMLDLPVPTAVFHNISVKPSEIQKQMVAELAEKSREGTKRYG